MEKTATIKKRAFLLWYD